MNRVTWRSLLCMNESTPDHDSENETPNPLNNTQMTNIISTLEGMMAQDRLLFMCSLVRFVLEMTQQISIAMATDQGPPVHDDPPGEDDNVMMMQTGLTLLNFARDKFNNIHHDLEKMGVHRCQRARALMQALESTWGPDIHQAVSADVQGLLAVLMVHGQERAADAEAPTTMEDQAWARTWLEEIRQTISDILRLPAQVADNTVVDVDTPVGVGFEMHARHEVEEERRRAMALQAEENATMRRAMSRPPTKSRRMQIDIVARSGDDTSRARLHLPPLSSTDCVQIQLGISTVESNLPTEHEGSTLMQTNMGTQRPLLKLLHPDARRRVLFRVLRDLRALLGQKLRECATMLREQHEIEQLLDGSAQAHREANDDDAAEDTFVADIADVHLQHLQAQMDGCLRPAQEVDVNNILRQMQQLQGHVDVVHDRVNTSQEAPARRTCLGTERQVLQLANRLLDEMQEHLYNYEGTDRADLLREMVVELVGGVQEKAATLLTLLHLVGHFLPQPFPISELTSHSRAMGRSYARDVISTIEAAFQVNASKELDGAAFGVSGILSIIPTLTHVATQSMVFFGRWTL